MATVLVTGCDTGLGVEFARQYAADGHRVIATCLDPARATETSAIKGNIEVVKLDVTDHAAIEALAQRMAGEPLDILLNNAGIGNPHPPFGKTDYAMWRRMLETNLIGPMKMAESFVEHVARSELKMMAFVSSRMGSIALNNSGASYGYRSSKSGLNMIVKTLAVDLALALDLRHRAASRMGRDRTRRTRAGGRERRRNARRDPPRRAASHRKLRDLSRSAAALVNRGLAPWQCAQSACQSGSMPIPVRFR